MSARETPRCSMAGVALSGGRYEIISAVADNPVRGLYLGRVTAGTGAGDPVLITTSNEQTVSIAELAERVVGDAPGIAELLYIGPLMPSVELRTGVGMVERRPPGTSLSEQALPLTECTVALLGARAAEICARAHAAHSVTPTLRPELMFAARTPDGLALTGIAPRCEQLHWTARGVDFGPAAVPPFEQLLAAPESAAGRHGQPADVYALAATLGVLATGRYPYTEPGWMLQAQAAVGGKPPSWTLPPALRDVLEPALAHDPAERPAMAELGAQLAAVARRNPA